MKLRSTEEVIRAHADALELAGACESAAVLSTLVQFLRNVRTRTMAELVKAGSGYAPYASGLNSSGPMSLDVVPHLKALDHILVSAHAATSQLKDLRLLIELLEGDSGYLAPMLDALLRALRPQKPEDRVSDYISKLRAETGTDNFDQILADLANSGLKTEQLVEIARSVYGGIPKKTSRKAALAYIRKPHDAFMSAKRGIEASGGRSAA